MMTLNFDINTWVCSYQVLECHALNCLWIQSLQLTRLCFYSSVRRRFRSIMAALIRHPSPTLLLFPLLLCQRGGTHRSHVHSILISSQCFRHTTSLRSNGPLIPLQPDGRSHPLRYRLCPGLLRRKLCSFGKVVGLRIRHLHRQHSHLAWCWRLLVEDHWFVVNHLLPVLPIFWLPQSCGHPPSSTIVL